MKSLLLSLALLVTAGESQALGRLASLEVLNRDTGQVLPVYRSRGEYWVAGTPGAKYAVVIRNQSAERVLAVTSVDGVNVISGEAAAFEQTGYVFSAHERYAIDGWRKSNEEIAAFNFSSLPDSYAARTRRPANVGVIGVALFLERPSPPTPYAPPSLPDAEARASHGPAATITEGAQRQQRRGGTAANDEAAVRLGTGHGALEYSYVSDVEFERRSSQPDEIIRIRYDSYENLVAMGVVSVRRGPPAPNPFPNAVQDRFVPDPPGQ